MTKVLLIEDDPFLIDIYTTKLKEEGFAVVGAQDGAKAISLAEKEKPEVIVLDIVLPHLDGWDILRALRKKKELADTKIIILSNLGQKEEVEKGLAMGADKYLIKAHYTPSEVVEEIKKLYAP